MSDGSKCELLIPHSERTRRRLSRTAPNVPACTTAGVALISGVRRALEVSHQLDTAVLIGIRSPIDQGASECGDVRLFGQLIGHTLCSVSVRAVTEQFFGHGSDRRCVGAIDQRFGYGGAVS